MKRKSKSLDFCRYLLRPKKEMATLVEYCIVLLHLQNRGEALVVEGRKNDAAEDVVIELAVLLLLATPLRHVVVVQADRSDGSVDLGGALGVVTQNGRRQGTAIVAAIADDVDDFAVRLTKYVLLLPPSFLTPS